MSNININKKNIDGSYDTTGYLFDAVDFYGGDHVQAILEISPAISERTPKYVKFSIVSKKDDKSYTFKQEKEGSYNLINSLHPGIKFYLTTVNNDKFFPDKNGIINLVNNLVQPMDVILNIVAEQYTIKDFNSTEIIEDIDIEVWSN